MEFSKNKFKPINDRYAKNRDGFSNFLYISCTICNNPLMIYQKDGKGSLLRCYADRIVWPQDLVNNQINFTVYNIKNIKSLACDACNTFFAHPTIYKSESRPAYRIIPGTLHINKKRP